MEIDNDTIKLEASSSNSSDSDDEEDFISIPMLGKTLMGLITTRPGMGTSAWALGLPDDPGKYSISRALSIAAEKTRRHLLDGEGDCDYDAHAKCRVCDKSDPHTSRTHFERSICSACPGDERLVSCSDMLKGDTVAFVCQECQRKWNPCGEEIELVPVNIYLAGDWRDPPLSTAKAFEEAGCNIVHKWWIPEEKIDTKTLDDLADQIGQADWFVLDMRSERFGNHYFAGSHIGVGIAHEQGARIMVIAPEDGEHSTASGLKYPGRTYTSLLTQFVVDNENGALEVLRGIRYGEEDYCDDDDCEGVCEQPCVISYR